MDKNYILCFEDGMIQHVKELTEELIEQAESGYMRIVNISDPNKPLILNSDNHWEALE